MLAKEKESRGKWEGKPRERTGATKGRDHQNVHMQQQFG